MCQFNFYLWQSLLPTSWSVPCPSVRSQHWTGSRTATHRWRTLHVGKSQRTDGQWWPMSHRVKTQQLGSLEGCFVVRIAITETEVLAKHPLKRFSNTVKSGWTAENEHSCYLQTECCQVKLCTVDKQSIITAAILTPTLCLSAITRHSRVNTQWHRGSGLIKKHKWNQFYYWLGGFTQIFSISLQISTRLFVPPVNPDPFCYIP